MYISYSGCCFVIFRRDCVTLQAFVDSGYERIHGTAKSSEIVHVACPDHGTEILFLLQEVHLVDDTVSVLVADPLSICETRIADNSNDRKLIKLIALEREKRTDDLIETK